MTRKESIEVINNHIEHWERLLREKICDETDGVETINAFNMAITALEQEPCEDCISRQAVIDGINEYFHDEYYQRTSIQDCKDCLIEDVIKDLPPVTPKPKTDVLDKIRAEIQAKYDSIPYRYNEYDDAWIDALEWVLESVIDKHISGKE